MTRALAVLLLLAAPAHAGYVNDVDTPWYDIQSLTTGALVGVPMQLTQNEKCHRRCDRKFPTPTPSPVPSPVPTKPPPPLPCEGFGVKSLEPGLARLICFDIATSHPHPIVEVKHRDTGNVHCALLESTLQSPAGGAPQYQIGSQIGGAMLKATGRWYWTVKLLDGCTSHEFYLVK